MKSYLKSFFERYDYPENATVPLLKAYDVLEGNTEFTALVDRFYTDDTLAAIDIEHMLDAVSEVSGVHKYTTKFLYYCALTRELPKKYAAAGIPESVMWDSLEDLKYKVHECLSVHGIAGFFSTTWFHGFFRLRIFKLGRLEYCVDTYNGDALTFGNITIKQGDRVISIHIPSSGEKFDRAARFGSYDRAYRFFREVRGEDACAFMCNSWLLYPDNARILPEKSNIVSFLEDFRIVSSKEYPDQRHDLWRIFGADADKPYEELPRDSSLRRAYAEWLCAGNKIGSGKGLFVWDPVLKAPIK